MAFVNKYYIQCITDATIPSVDERKVDITIFPSYK